MTKEELIRMANQAFDESSFTDSEVLRFAALVAAAERERVVGIAKDMQRELQAKFEQVYMEGAIAGAAAEREACAKLVEPSAEHRRDASWGYLGGKEGVDMLDEIAAAIRARSEI